MKHLLGASSGVQVIQTVGSTSLFICLCLAAVSCSKGNCVTSTDFRRASLTVDGKEIRFEYRTISPPISVGAPLEQQGTESAHRAWLRVYHYEASGEYESIVDLAGCVPSGLRTSRIPRFTCPSSTHEPELARSSGVPISWIAAFPCRGTNASPT